MTSKTDAFLEIAPLLGMTGGEARLWARHLREAGFIDASLPGRGVSHATEDELVNFVVGFSCCRHAKHAPKYLGVVRDMTRVDRIAADDPEARPLPSFLNHRNVIDAFKGLMWDVYHGRFSEWGRSSVPPGGIPNSGGIFVEFTQDGAAVAIEGIRYEPDEAGIHRRAARFRAEFGTTLENLKVIHRDADDLPIDTELRITKTLGFRTLHKMAEILIGS